MVKIRIWILLGLVCVLFGFAQGQLNPYYKWTFLPQEQMNEIIGEASGETAWNTIMETGGYNKDRLSEEYVTTFYESQFIFDRLKQYGLDGSAIVRFPGRTVWDGIKGELWEVKPIRQKLASYRDMTAMLARGSKSADVKAELVWVGQGTEQEIENADVSGKIVVTDGSLYSVHNLACQQKGALGLVVISTSRPHFDPMQIPWRGIYSRRGGGESKFAFYLTAREGELLKKRLLRGIKITVHAQVETKEEPYELQNVICHIPGTDPSAGEIIFSAHLFEGYVKQGANDNKSGSAGILEVARVLHTLIKENRIQRPERTIRFLWGPEFSGTGPWVKANKDIMENTLCNINMDMVGEWLSKNQAFMCLMRTNYGHAHYINDVMENYYRFVGEHSRSRIHGTRSASGSPGRIVAPTGADEPFYYSIETHYGASDHEVFNDWGVGVPGIMMIAWPDQWYHTSGDRVDKSDPTQLKRVVVIGAAAAYTIANADDDMAIKIAAEIVSNGTRRLGHQLILGLEKLNKATSGSLINDYKMARIYVETALSAERATLESVVELSENKSKVGNYVLKMKKNIDAIGKAHLAVLEEHMKIAAGCLNKKPVRLQLNKLEKKAAGIVPRPTSRITENGYRGYRTFIDQIPESEKEKFPYDRRSISNMSELQRLINGKNSILDIKWMLDAQSSRKSDLQKVMNYLEILKLAGLIEM